MPETILYEKKDHLAILTFNRPDAANAMNGQMQKELAEALVDFRDDPNSWVMIITGAGERHFSSGLDLKEFTSRLAQGLSPVDPEIMKLPNLMFGTVDIWKPIIAAINGSCMGGGLEYALCCDIRIAADHSMLGLTEAQRGIIPGGGGMIRLPRVVAMPIAMEMMLTAKRLTAAEAKEIGLVNQVVPAAELMDAAYKMAEKILDCAPLAIQAIKEVVTKTIEMPLKEGLEKQMTIGPNVMGSQDAAEGPRAFAEKRKPQWSGK
ncbi:MAG: enoyl-CoA hydratase-related protein [Chloroflexota bacterium]|nr:enoyl-CoA hydratase-related protein [Chloroflexota bacterium]